MTRSTDEWVGRTDDAKIPPRVRLRVFLAYAGKCYRTGQKLRPGHWQLDHIIALANGGEHREKNLAPIETEAHRFKTAEDVRIKAKLARTAAKHSGAVRPKGWGPKNRKLSGKVGLTKRAQRETDQTTGASGAVGDQANKDFQ